jgi:hypothetical protein
MRTWCIAAIAFSVVAGASAGELDDAQRLFDFTEAYYRAEAKVVADHEALLKDFARILLKARLRAIADQREILGAAAREHRAIAIEEGGFCDIHVGGHWPSHDTPEYKALVEYLKSHFDLDRRYVAVSEQHYAEILKASGTDSTQWHALRKRFIPDMYEDLPNKAAEPTRATVTPPADAGDRASGARGSP